MKWADSLPDLVVRIVACPYGYFGKYEQEVNNEEYDGGSSDLIYKECTILSARVSLRFCHTK